MISANLQPWLAKFQSQLESPEATKNHAHQKQEEEEDYAGILCSDKPWFVQGLPGL